MPSTLRDPSAGPRHVVILHHPSGDGEALYVDGKLVTADHDVTEKALEVLGAETRHDVDFLHGEHAWNAAFDTLEEVEAYEADLAANKIRAESLRVQAAELLARADQLEGKNR